MLHVRVEIGVINIMQTLENLFFYSLLAILIIIFGYIMVRIGSAAYFKSKKDFLKDSKTDNPKQPQ